MCRQLAGTALLIATTFGTASTLGAQQSSPASVSPGPRKGHALVYDSSTRRVLLVDASPRIADSIPRREEIWSWDGVHWNLLTGLTPDIAPSGHTTGGVVYDPRRNVITIFGGRTGMMTPNEVVGDTWEWNKSAWRQANDTSVGARDHVAIAYDHRRGRAVLFGGTVFPRVTGPWSTETWESTVNSVTRGGQHSAGAGYL